MKTAIIDGKVVTTQKQRNPRARVLDARFKARIAAMREEYRRIQEEHQAAMDKQHAELTEKIEAAKLELVTLSEDIAKKVDDMVALQSIIVDHEATVRRIERTQILNASIIKEVGGAATVAKYPGLASDIFLSALRRVIEEGE